MFASKGFRTAALLATLTMALSFVAIDTAEARRGGSFGSRGIRTERVIPATPTSPGVTAPVNRTMTQPGATRNGTAAAPARPSLFGGIGGALLGGLLFTGLFGMLFGFGFGGFGGVLALLFQLVILVVGLNLLFRWLGRRQQPAMARGGATPFEARSYGGGGGRADSAPRSTASQRAGSRDEIGITDGDLGSFEELLRALQDAYSREDYDALRRITTPEVMSYLAEELAANASKGVRNEVFDVRLLSGDIAEAWREGGSDYATVSMRYESRDLTRERASGAIVSGDDRVTETTEVWTFVRRPGAGWLVSAIQDA